MCDICTQAHVCRAGASRLDSDVCVCVCGQRGGARVGYVCKGVPRMLWPAGCGGRDESLFTSECFCCGREGKVEAV